MTRPPKQSKPSPRHCAKKLTCIRYASASSLSSSRSCTHKQSPSGYVQDLLDDSEEALAYLMQVNFFAQCRGEGFDCFGGRVIAQMKALLEERLQVRAKRHQNDRDG